MTLSADFKLTFLGLAEVLVGLATDPTVYLSRRGGTLKVNKLTFTCGAEQSLEAVLLQTVDERRNRVGLVTRRRIRRLRFRVPEFGFG